MNAELHKVLNEAHLLLAEIRGNVRGPVSNNLPAETLAGMVRPKADAAFELVGRAIRLNDPRS